MPALATPLTELLGIDVPIIGGAMYPCSNPGLVAAVSAAGGIGVIQPVSIIYAHSQDLRAGIREIRSLTDRPVGFNAIVERSKMLRRQMSSWIDVALDEGVRFFVTALGDPRWVVDRVHAVGGICFHDVTERRWALKALDAGVDGLICVNGRAGGHAGSREPQALYEELADLGVPLVAAGGVGGPRAFVEALRIGYAGVQVGSRFIATPECNVHADYKRAIVRARPEDVVLTDKISGVPCAVIKTPFVEKMGTKAGPIARRLLQHPRTKHWMRSLYSLQSVWKFKRAAARGSSYKDYFQAGKSVGEIDAVVPVAGIVDQMTAAAREAGFGDAGGAPGNGPA